MTDATPAPPAPDAQPPQPPPSSAKAPEGKPAEPAGPPKIVIDDFKKIDLKVAKVIESTDHPNADRLLVLKLDIGGGETRQVCSGIKQWYQAADLVGKNVILVANLEPRKMRGVESQGMVLAATSGDSVIVLVTDRDAVPGSKVS